MVVVASIKNCHTIKIYHIRSSASMPQLVASIFLLPYGKKLTLQQEHKNISVFFSTTSCNEQEGM